MPHLSQARLRHLLDYSPKTGQFTWRVNGRNQHMRAGAVAGCLTPDARWKIGVDGDKYLANRLAVLWMTGTLPSSRFTISHANGDSADNCWTNLRVATYSQHSANMRARVRPLPKGVCWDTWSGRYMAKIRVNYRTINLGRFDDPNKAHRAYVAAAKRYFGEFARAK